jgi:hypothetical protein
MQQVTAFGADREEETRKEYLQRTPTERTRKQLYIVNRWGEDLIQEYQEQDGLMFEDGVG